MEETIDYHGMKVKDLRVAAQADGWTGTDRFNMNKDELVQFMITGHLPPIRYELDGDKLTISRRPVTIAELMELTEKLTPNFPKKSAYGNSRKDSPGKSNKRERGRGRPKTAPPADNAPFVTAITEAFHQGRPFRKTSVRGVFRRREELPVPFNTMGKHSLERFVTGLLNAGLLKLEKGDLLA